MAMIETVIVRKPWDVDRRLNELGLDRKTLLKVVAVALAASADATPFHPANAAGTLAYQHGTFALRDEFVGAIWTLDRPDGVEAISNETKKVKVAFANVDSTCQDEHLPKPRSRKGAGAERVCNGSLFDDLPHFAPAQSGAWATFYLMVDQDGAAELSRPVVENGTFEFCIERIYLTDGADLDRIVLPLDDDDVAEGFDPHVARK